MSAKAPVQNVDLLALEQLVSFALAIAHRGMLAACRPLPKSLRLRHPQYLVMHAPTASLEIEPQDVVRQADNRCTAAGFGHTVARHGGRAHRSSRFDRRWLRALIADGFALRGQTLKIPPAVVERLGDNLEQRERLPDVLRRTAAALAARAIADERTDR
jgi:hypothetical protein